MKNILLVITIILLVNIRFIHQPEYKHTVIGLRLPNVCVVLYDNELECIWIGDRCFSEIEEEEYLNI